MSFKGKFIFIDGGAHTFETSHTCWNIKTEYTKESNGSGNVLMDEANNCPFFTNVNNIKDVEFHLFECFEGNVTIGIHKGKKLMDVLETNIEKVKNQFGCNIILNKKAIYIHNNTINFYESIDKWGEVGCTLKAEKKEKLDLVKPRSVQACNISEYIKQFNDNDYIVLKLDVEGAEYDILEYMMSNGSLKRINLLYIEWHNQFFPEKKNSYQNILTYILYHSINYREWKY